MNSPPPLSYRTRLTIRWTVVFSCVLAAANAAIYFGVRATSFADLDNHLRTLGGTEVTSAFDAPDSAPHVHELPVTALAGGTFIEKLVQILDDNGTVVAASRGTEGMHLVDPSLRAASLAGEAPVTTVFVDRMPVRVVALRTSAAGRTYIVAVGVVIADMLAGLNRIGWLLVLVWAAATAATAVAGSVLASIALDPVRRITRRAMEIARTDIRARLEPSHITDDIGLMTQSLNTLIERLHVALEANRRFAAEAAHELRSPVTAMAGEIDVALRRERSSEEYRETLALVRNRLSSLASLISDLMLLVRAQEADAKIAREDVALEGLLQASVGRLAPIARSRGVRVRVQPLGGLVARADAGLLARAFDNVLENAIRYNREEGEVVVEAALTEGGQPPSEPKASGVVVIRIADTGPGIPEQDRERVFDRFYRVDHSRNRHTGGAGLGLAITREVLALFDGTIRIERSSPTGTTVEIRLPGSREGDGEARRQEAAPVRRRVQTPV